MTIRLSGLLQNFPDTTRGCDPRQRLRRAVVRQVNGRDGRGCVPNTLRRASATAPVIFVALIEEVGFAMDLYGAFPVKRLFWVVLTVFVRSGKGRFSSRRLRSGSRSARKGSRD